MKLLKLNQKYILRLVLKTWFTLSKKFNIWLKTPLNCLWSRNCWINSRVRQPILEFITFYSRSLFTFFDPKAYFVLNKTRIKYRVFSETDPSATADFTRYLECKLIQWRLSIYLKVHRSLWVPFSWNSQYYKIDIVFIKRVHAEGILFMKPDVTEVTVYKKMWNLFIP